MGGTSLLCRFLTRVSELVPFSGIDTLFSILRLRNLCLLSIRAIREIRGHANLDRLPFKGCFLVPPVQDCWLNQSTVFSNPWSILLHSPRLAGIHLRFSSSFLVAAMLH